MATRRVNESSDQCDGQLNGSQLLWKGSVEMLKNLMSELLQEQGKWISSGGGVR
jgi:hypothetical protein